MSDGVHDHALIMAETNSGLPPSQFAIRASSAALYSAALPGALQVPVIGRPPWRVVSGSPPQVWMIPLPGVSAAPPDPISGESRTHSLPCRPLNTYTWS